MDNDNSPNGVMTIFDFDKTLVRIDSFRLFAHLIAGTIRGRLWCLWLAVLCKFRFMSNTRYKERILETFWFSRTPESRAAILESFHRQLHEKQNALVTSYMLEHARNGDSVAVISASPEFLLKPFMHSLCPSAQVRGSTVREDGPSVIVKNLRGDRKAEAARALIEKDRPRRIFVYTDDIVDLPLVRLCDRAVLVRPSRRFVREVEKLGIQFETIR